MKHMIFYGNYKNQTILFLVTIIFIIMLTAYHFGKYFRTKFLFLENINNCEQNYT